MKKVIKTSVFLILIFVCYMLTESNAKILSYTNQVHFDFLGQGAEEYMAIIKGLGFSWATIIIVVYHKKLSVKIMFVLLDVYIVHVFHYIDKDIWFKYTSFYYSGMTGLIFLFVGLAAYDFYLESQKKPKKTFKTNNSNHPVILSPDHVNELKKLQLENKETEIKSLMLKLKRTGQKGGPYTDYPERVEKMKEYEKQLIGIEKDIQKISAN